MERMPHPTRSRPASPAATVLASAFSILAALTCFGGAVGAVLDSPGAVATPAEALPAEA